MAEETWTTYKIGGEIKSPAVLEQLLVLADEFGETGAPERSDVMDAIVAKTPLAIEGQLNYGTFRSLDAFLQEQALPFSAHFSARSGVFDAGIRFWQRGMAASQDRPADDDGNPTVDLPTLKTAESEGRPLADVIAYLEASIAVPPLTAAAGVFADTARQSIAERMGHPTALKTVEVVSEGNRIEIALVPARRGYFVAVHTNCDPDNPTFGSSSREDFSDVILAAAAFERSVKEAKGELVAEENA